MCFQRSPVNLPALPCLQMIGSMSNSKNQTIMNSQHNPTHPPSLWLLAATAEQPGRPVTHLACAVAALPRQVLSMDQRARGSTALKWEPGVDERGGAGVVVHKECLGDNPLSGQCMPHTGLSRPATSHIQGKAHC